MRCKVDEEWGLPKNCLLQFPIVIKIFYEYDLNVHRMHVLSLSTASLFIIFFELSIPALILSKIRTFSVSHGMLNTGVFIQVSGTSPTIDDW